MLKSSGETHIGERIHVTLGSGGLTAVVDQLSRRREMAAKKLSFEEKLSRLEEIVAALEKGDAPLADSLAVI